MGFSGEASRHFLLDPDFWRPRLERLNESPRQLAIFPRPDLARPGIEVVELRMKAHDGGRLVALLARSSFAQTGEEVRLRPCPDLQDACLDWGAVEAGSSDLVYCYPSDRGLEDRVLDVLRLLGAACSLESVECGKVHLGDEEEPTRDEFSIARFLQNRGWA